MTHEMHLAAAPFALIACGKKTIELRLFDEKRRRIRVGDEIVFDCGGALLRVCVTELLRAPSFLRLLSDPAVRAAAGFEGSAEAAADAMRAFYAPDAERACGVVGIRFIRSDGQTERPENFA